MSSLHPPVFQTRRPPPRSQPSLKGPSPKGHIWCALLCESHSVSVAPWVSKERTPMSYETYWNLRCCFQSFVCIAFQVLGGQKPKNKKLIKIQNSGQLKSAAASGVCAFVGKQGWRMQCKHCGSWLIASKHSETVTKAQGVTREPRDRPPHPDSTL